MEVWALKTPVTVARQYTPECTKHNFHADFFMWGAQAAISTDLWLWELFSYSTVLGQTSNKKVAAQKPHLPSKDSSGSASCQLMKEEGYMCIILGETQPPPINKCIDTQMGCISLASNTKLGINVVIVCTDTSLTLTNICSVFKQQRPGRRNLYHTLYTPSILVLQELEGHAVKIANLLF